ncbi:MAG: hypothetical protein IT223_12930 [Crocinitomicaceae bacterium]|nr:hypothetical protein [Crocinitomicaceae bacterium]
MKIQIVLAAGIYLCISSSGLLAQTEGSAFTITGHGVATPFATDYQSLGINPANLDLTSPYTGKRVTIGLCEIGASFYSEILTKPELKQNLFQEDIKDLTQEQQREYAMEFANSANSGDLDLMSMGFALQTSKVGSFAFSIRERADFFSKLGPQVSDLVWLGYTAPYFEQLVLENGDTIPNSDNISQDTLDMVMQGFTTLANAGNLSEIMQGTHFRFSWIREYNFGYGKKLMSTDNMELHGGIGLKLLVGQGLLDLEGKNGDAYGFSALSPIFQIDYEDISDENPSAIDEDAKPLKPVGMGFGVDLGTTLLIKNKFIISAAVNDIGSMTWNGNVYKLRDLKLTDFTSSGLESVSFIEQINQLNGGDGVIEWQGASAIKTKLPTQGRLGFGIVLNQKLKGGVDFVTPMNEEVGSLDKPVISIGGEFSPLPWVHLSLGVINGGNYDTKVPAGIRFVVGNGSYELGIASRDLVTFFTNNQPTVSLSTGFLRFRF